MKQKKPLNLNPFVLIFAVVVVAWLFTFIITPGTLVDGVYTALPKNAFNFNNVFNLFRAVPMGIKDTSNLVILVLVIGGALEIYKSTGAIDSSITKMVHKFGSGSRTFLLIALMVLFSVIGGFLGWIETLIPFAPLVVAMILALGYDGIVACAVLIIGLMGGFVTGPTNLYTVGVCNGILQNMGLLSAGLPRRAVGYHDHHRRGLHRGVCQPYRQGPRKEFSPRRRRLRSGAGHQQGRHRYRPPRGGAAEHFGRYDYDRHRYAEGLRRREVGH